MERPKLQLVGALYTGSPDETLPFLYETFGRFREVKSVPELTRQVQYASGYAKDDYVHFMGIEVNEIEHIPDGMIAWKVDGDRFAVLGPEDDVIWQGEIAWRWCDTSVGGRVCGEFNASCPVCWKGISGLCEFRTISQSYIGAPSNDDILLVDYDPTWPEKFQEMKEWIEKVLGSDVARKIEHYGSTSIPGMPAKPVIDILVEVPSWEDARKRAIPAFNTPEIEYWCSDHMRFYIRDRKTGVRTCHLHMAPAGHRIWEGLAFRDHLRSHPEDARRYLVLKRQLVERHPDDRLAYTNAKEAFVREITDRALGRTG